MIYWPHVSEKFQISNFQILLQLTGTTKNMCHFWNTLYNYNFLHYLLKPDTLNAQSHYLLKPT